MLLITYAITLIHLNLLVFGEYSSPKKIPVQSSHLDEEYNSKPFVNGALTFYGGIINEWNGNNADVTSPIIDEATGKRTIIGKLAQLTVDEAQKVVQIAKKAWNYGQGKWTQLSMEERIEAIERVVIALKSKRDEIIKVLMWEICKTSDDAAAEFDRTMLFIEATIKAYREFDTSTGRWSTIGGILSKVRRAAIDIMLCLGPFNYPFNETYATLIPALLAGNIIIMKIPNTGGLAHVLTMQAYAENLPPGTINFFSGSGIVVTKSIELLNIVLLFNIRCQYTIQYTYIYNSIYN
jgi:glyceraldehyde-3-phosphate dehydrogenase (NADP+)